MKGLLGAEDQTARMPLGFSAPRAALRPSSVVEPVIGLARQSFRAVVDVKQDRVIGQPAGVDEPSDIPLVNVHTRILEGRLEYPSQRTAGPGTTAGTSSATVIRASAPRTVRAARSVKPMPNPPMRICGRLWSLILSHENVASASSEPVRRLLISWIVPSMIENSASRCIRRNSPPPGTTARSISAQGIMELSAGSGLVGSGQRFLPSSAAMSFTMRPTFRCAAVI